MRRDVESLMIIYALLNSLRRVNLRKPSTCATRERVCLRVPAAIFMKHLRLNNLCDIIILIISRHYYIQKYDVYATFHEKKGRPEHISSIIMTLNNSNKLNDNEMLICQRLKLTVFFALINE